VTGRRSRWVGPVAAVAVAVCVAVALLAGARDPASPPPAPRGDPAEASPVAVSSDAPRFSQLDELVAAADLVVTGEVAAVARGRTFGEPGGTAIVSRVVTLQVDSVLAGTPPEGGADVLVEEEGWLADGRAVAVDGAAPTQEGDRGIWFLVDVGDPELPLYTVVNAEGRYLVGGDDGDGLVGAAGDDPLIARVEAMGADALVDEVRQAWRRGSDRSAPR